MAKAEEHSVLLVDLKPWIRNQIGKVIIALLNLGGYSRVPQHRFAFQQARLPCWRRLVMH